MNSMAHTHIAYTWEYPSRDLPKAITSVGVRTFQSVFCSKGLKWPSKIQPFLGSFKNAAYNFFSFLTRLDDVLIKN